MTAAAGGISLAAGYAGLAFAHTPAGAFAAAALAGNGALLPTQPTLLATLAPPDRRHRASAVARVSTNALATAAYAMTLERRLPKTARLTPRSA